MGGFKKLTFDEETRHLDQNSEEYKAAKRRHEAVERAATEQHMYDHKMVLRILELTGPVRALNVSKLGNIGRARLIAMGKAARALNDEMKKAGIITGSFSSGKWSDF